MAHSELMMTAEEIRARQRKRRRILITSMILFVAIVFGIFGGRPTLNAIKSWQARRHAAKAFDYIEKENWTEARKEATSAYQLRSTEPESIRAVARFLSRTRQPDALEFWQQLENVTTLTREDRLDEASIALALGEMDRADAAVKALRDSKEMDATGWLLAAQLSIQKGAADDAMSALNNIFNDAHANEQQQLQAALLELNLASGSGPADERLTDAWSRIEKISKGKSATARDALVLLAQRSVTPSPDGTRPIAMTTEEIRTALENHPLSKAPQKLLALDLLEHAESASPARTSRRDELIARGIDQFKNGDPSDLLALATWLNGKAEFQKTIDTIPVEKALTSRELFLQYLDALGGLDRWSEVKQLLESDRFPLDAVIQHMYLARCNAQLGEKAAAENNWQRALEAAAGDPGKLLNLGEYAEKNGNIEIAQSAFDAAARQSPKLRLAQQGRLRIAQRSGDTNKIHAVLADMLKIWPNDAAVQNDEGYTRLLLMNQQQPRGRSAQLPTSNSNLPPASSQLPSPNSELDSLVELAAKLVVKNPRSLPHRTFLALAYLKSNRPADALVVYKDVTVARNALTPSALAVHAAVLAANGQAEDAQTEARQVKLDQLLPQERKLIEPLTWDLNRR